MDALKVALGDSGVQLKQPLKVRYLKHTCCAVEIVLTFVFLLFTHVFSLIIS